MKSRFKKKRRRTILSHCSPLSQLIELKHLKRCIVHLFNYYINADGHGKLFNHIRSFTLQMVCIFFFKIK